jgi:hypothetical protein
MVHAVPVSVRHGKNVVAFAVRVVDDDVEHRHASERRRVFVNEGDHPPVLIPSFENALPARLRHLVRRDKVDGALGRVWLPPELHHSLAERTIAQPGARNDVPAEDLRNQVRGHFPVSQGAVGKIPQRTFAC